MSLTYRLGCSTIRAALAVAPLATALTAFSRIWSRHSRIHRHLVTAGYDGVIDGGANVGEFAGLVRSALPGADLLCVEPHPECAALLRADGYRVVEAALWKTKGRITLSQPAEATTSCTVMQNNSRTLGSWEVETVRLKDLPITGNNILVKLDLQGAEIEAFKGMGSLWETCTAVLSEVSMGPDGNYEKIRALLDAHGFRESSTLNELEEDNMVVEADKLWVRSTR